MVVPSNASRYRPVLPLVLCVDIEPDRRVTALTGGDARLTWCLRMDPGLHDTYGSANSWRWRDGGWVSDQAVMQDFRLCSSSTTIGARASEMPCGSTDPASMTGVS